MKKIIPFRKDILFKTKIYELTSISLEHTLKLEEADYISGEFIISGEYKITDASVNHEPFSYNIPFDIGLDAKYNVNNAKLEIDDFYYEIINSEVLRVNIDVLLDGIEMELQAEFVREEAANEDEGNEEDDSLEIDVQVDPEEEFEEINFDDIADEFEPEVEEEIIESRGDEDVKLDTHVSNETDRNDLFQEVDPKVEAVSSEVKEDSNAGEKIRSLFDSMDDKDETFSTYHVHIVRDEDTIDVIMAKYSVGKEELELYNNVDEIKTGDKIIIPAASNE